MTVHDIVAQIPYLTIEDQLVVLEAITQSLRASVVAPSLPAHESLVDHLYGAFKPDGPALTDADVERIRDEALTEKYA